MKSLLIIVFALALAVGIGINLHHHQGLVVLTFAGWRVDMPLWLAALGVILVYVIFYYVSSFLAAIIDSAKTFKNFAFGYRRRQAKKLTSKGFMALTMGDYQKAERYLIKAAENSEFPWLNYLTAANAAQIQGALSKRDEYLDKAKACLPEGEEAFDLAQSKFEYDQGQYDKARVMLESLKQKLPHHPQVLKLLQKVYLAQGDFETLCHLLPELKQDHVLPQNVYQALEASVWRELLLKAKNHLAYAYGEEVWHKMPRHLHQDPDIVFIYANMLKENRKYVEAEAILRDVISHHWNDKLVRLYGMLMHPNSNKMLTLAEKWLKTHPESPGLLLTLGRLCEQQELWGKAQRYFEASLSLDPHPETYAELGALWEKLDKPEVGAQYFKKGLLLAAPINENLL